jgi:hypothetical protein
MVVAIPYYNINQQQEAIMSMASTITSIREMERELEYQPLDLDSMDCIEIRDYYNWLVDGISHPFGMARIEVNDF